jgi:hypothetical protein
MVSLMHAWNAWNRGRYLAIPYEWERIGKFAAVYVALAAAYSFHRELTVPAEIALSVAGAALLLCVVYSLLGDTERKALTGWLASREGPVSARPDADDHDKRK